MSTLHHPSGGFPLDPQSEVNELRDIGAPDLTPTVGSAVAWNVVDQMWAAEMERRDRAATCPAGDRDAACEACGCGLYVPVGQGGDLLCPQCQRDGEALVADNAAEGDGGGRGRRRRGRCTQTTRSSRRSLLTSWTTNFAKRSVSPMRRQ